MNYLRIYDDLISSRLNLQVIRSKQKKNKEEYYENHHIIPKCMGGDNSKSNLILLTPKEHFIAHWLLWKGHNLLKLSRAFYIMTITNHPSGKRHSIKSSKVYDTLRKESARYMSEIFKGRVVTDETRQKLSKANKGKKKSQESKDKQSKSISGELHWNYGKTRPDDTKEKISKSLTGRKFEGEQLETARKSILRAVESKQNNGIDYSLWNLNRKSNEIWKIADLIYDEWINTKRPNKKSPGSRTLSFIIDRLSKEYGIKTHARNETMLRYFREHGNPLNNSDWVNKFKSS